MGLNYVREEQGFACWAHDPKVVSSNLTSNIRIHNLNAKQKYKK